MQKNKFTIVANLLGITTNVSNIHYFSFGFFDKVIHSDSKEEFNVSFKLVDSLSTGPTLSKIDYFHKVKEGILFFRPGFIPLKLLFKNSSKYLVEVVCERKFYNTLTLGVEGLLPPGKLFFKVILYKLLLNKILPLHCSGVDIGKAQILFVAGSNTGKSFSAFNLAKQFGGKILTEDIALFDGKECHGVHGLSAYSDYIVDRSYKFSLHNILPFAKYFPSKKIFVSKYEKMFTNKMKPSHLVILDRGEANSVEKLSSTRAKQLLQALNRFEFGYSDSDVLRATCFLENDDIESRVVANEQLLLDKLTRVPKVYKVTAQDHEKLFELTSSLFN